MVSIFSLPSLPHNEVDFSPRWLYFSKKKRVEPIHCFVEIPGDLFILSPLDGVLIKSSCRNSLIHSVSHCKTNGRCCLTQSTK